MDRALHRPDWRAPLAAAAAAAGYVLGAHADIVAPLELVLRPLTVAAAIGLVVGLLTAWTGAWAVPLAVVAVASIAHPSSGIFLVMLIPAIWILGRLRRRPLDLGGPVTIMALAFFAVGIVRAVPNLPPPGVAAAREERSVYLVLLDGYPRIDSLAEHGIDNSAFIEALEARGFDHYPDAHTLHRWTDRTLTAMLTGPEDVPDAVSIGQERVDVHRALQVPAGFVAIAPPVVHIVMYGAKLPVESVTDFDAHLIGRSLAPLLARDQLRAWISDDLDRRIDESLAYMAKSPGPLFVHLMTPHPPFPGGPECWPECQFFENFAEDQGLSLDEWWGRLGSRLTTLNGKLLDAVDAVIARDPRATIVLFSDHGGRAGPEDPAEWYRTLMVARTPDRPMLFADEPRPDAILRLTDPASRGVRDSR